MPRTLILMRHARQSTLASRDHERPLTNEGRDAAHTVGTRLAGEGETGRLDHVLASTALRCRETWAAVEAGLGRSVSVDFEARLYNASPGELLDEVAGIDPAVESLLLLAHNPGMSLLALELVRGDEEARRILGAGFTPATTAAFEIDGAWSQVAPRTARLLRFDPGP